MVFSALAECLSCDLVKTLVNVAPDQPPFHDSSRAHPALRSAQVMRVKWACPAGMWGLRRHSCCSMRGSPGRDSGNWSLSTSDTPQAFCLLFLKGRPQLVPCWAASVSGFITDTTWKIESEVENVWKLRCELCSGSVVLWNTSRIRTRESAFVTLLKLFTSLRQFDVDAHVQNPQTTEQHHLMLSFCSSASQLHYVGSSQFPLRNTNQDLRFLSCLWELGCGLAFGRSCSWFSAEFRWPCCRVVMNCFNYVPHISLEIWHEIKPQKLNPKMERLQFTEQRAGLYTAC